MAMPDARAESPGELLQSAARALAVLDALAGHPDGATPKAISAELGLHLSTAYRLLNTLKAADFVVRDPASLLFRLGPRIPVLHSAFMASLNVPPEVLPFLNALHEVTGAAVYLGQWLGNHVVISAIVETRRPPLSWTGKVGCIGIAHTMAVGRVLLAWAPPGSLDAYLADLASGRGTGSTSPWALRSQLAQICAAGYAIERAQEPITGAYSLAAPVLDRDGVARHGLAIMVPSERFTREEDALAAAVRGIADAFGVIIRSGAPDNGWTTSAATSASLQAALHAARTMADENCPLPRQCGGRSRRAQTRR